MTKKDSTVMPVKPDNRSLADLIDGERKGVFEQGKDKLGRPYEKKFDENGFYTKEEILKDGTPKLTIKKLSQ